MKKLLAALKGFLSGDFGSELVRYFAAGVITTAGNYALFAALGLAGLEYKIANIITLVVVKTAAYLLNKLYVYRAAGGSAGDTALELIKYILSRTFTGLLDYFGLILLVDRLSVNKYAGKAIVMALVIIINYCLGKFFVFTGKKDASGKM